MGFFSRRSRFLPYLLVILLLVSGCSDDPTGPKELKPLVGVWKATELVMTSQVNPNISLDLIQEGATFTLSILADGQYSASLTILGQSSSELGKVTLSGNTVSIAPTSPQGPPLVATWAIEGETLTLDGESEFDFNRDGTAEPALAHIVLESRQN